MLEIAFVAAIRSTVDVVALPDGNYIVVYTNTTSGPASVYGQVVDRMGRKVGDVFSVSTGESGDPATALLPNGELAVAYFTPVGIAVQRLTTAGAKVGSPVVVSSSANAFHPSITVFADGRFVVTYEALENVDGNAAGSGIRAQLLAADTTRIGTEFAVNATARDNQTFPDVATLKNGNALFVWTDASETVGDTSGTAIRARVYAIRPGP